jgi:hypothetical protein
MLDDEEPSLLDQLADATTKRSKGLRRGGATNRTPCVLLEVARASPAIPIALADWGPAQMLGPTKALAGTTEWD